MNDGVIDLGKTRAERREGKAQEVRVRLGEGVEPIVLPVEFPVDALSPVEAIGIQDDLGLLLRVQNRQDGEQMLRDLITVHPELGGQLLNAVKGVLERLFCSHVEPHDESAGTDEAGAATTVKVGGCNVEVHQHDVECQYPRFLSWRPTVQDYIELAKGLWDQYGGSLGEAFSPAGSSGPGGATSSPTSPASTTDSTPAESGPTPAPIGS